MSNSAAADARHVRAQMLFHLGACLSEWSRALSHGSDHPSIPSLRSYSVQVIPQLSAAGFGDIAHHLVELVRRVDAKGSLGDPLRPLQALLDATERARSSLAAEERASGSPELATSEHASKVPARSVSACEHERDPSSALATPHASNSTDAFARRAGAAAPGVPLERSLLGLRAFRAREHDRSSHRAVGAAASNPAPLGLGQNPASGRADPLVTSANPSANAPASNVKELLGGIERKRGSRARLEQPAQAAAGPRRWMRFVPLTLTGIGAAGLAVAITAWTQSATNAAKSAASTPVSAAASVLPGSSALPSRSLLTEDETFSALLAQVHGRGKESSELQALVNEQAALVARSQRKCEGSVAECSQLAKLREGVLGAAGVKRIAKRRSIPGTPGRVPARWLAGLELPEIPIEDDPRVQRSLEYYAERPVGRELFQGMLFRCGAYREAIESTLVRNGMPKDILAIVFAESGCEPEAVSPVGAAGLWQLMPDTARAYGLRVNKGVVDERRNAPKSTEAAVRFLRDLRDKMAGYYAKGVWDLVFGSYNMGPFAMAARVEHAGGDVGFWDLVDAQRLPDETVHYTPTVQALALILRNLQRFKFAGVQMRAPQLTSELEVQPGTRLSLIARAASTSLERIRALNLDIMSDRTPDVANFVVQVPKEVVWQARESLAELVASRDESDLCVPAGFDWGRKHFSKEMADSCKRKLKSKQLGPATPSSPGSRG